MRRLPPTARSVGGLFFPQRTELGLDARAATPELVRTVCHLATEVRSFERVSVVMKRVWGVEISDTTINRLARQVGGELSEREANQQQGGDKEVVVPAMAVVCCDGGRIRTREPGRGRGVRLSGETGWRETKNALFDRMTPQGEHCPGVDPCPQLPSSFRSVKKVAEIAGKALPEVRDVGGEGEQVPERIVYRGPRRVLRTVLSSMACSEDFGRMMEREARRRRFFEAPRRAFLGDGLPWNWSIWKEHFPDFTPILDFIHVLQYLYQAAEALGEDEQAGWSLYVEHVTLCWAGRVDQVIAELTAACQRQGVDPGEKLPEDHPLKPVTDAVRYLDNNRQRMKYPEYRKAGLPVTSAPMESLIKQINMRVKGTEMFWDDPAGAEAILHLRAASLCDDDRLNEYLKTRPGYPFIRRSTSLNAA